jgi:hypothetical protein
VSGHAALPPEVPLLLVSGSADVVVVLVVVEDEVDEVDEDVVVADDAPLSAHATQITKTSAPHERMGES